MRELVDKLASFSKVVPETDKVQYLLKSLPETFSATAQTANFIPDLNFEKLEQAIRKEVDRRKITGVHHGKRETSTQFRAASASTPSFQTIGSRGGRGRVGYRGRARGRGYNFRAVVAVDTATLSAIVESTTTPLDSMDAFDAEVRTTSFVIAHIHLQLDRLEDVVVVADKVLHTILLAGGMRSKDRGRTLQTNRHSFLRRSPCRPTP